MGDSTDFLVIFVPIVIAIVIYMLVYGVKKPSGAQATKVDREVSLSPLPIVTITANHILLDDNLKMDDQTRSALELLSKRACVFVIVVVEDLAEQKRIEGEVASAFSGIIPEMNILYSQTAIGRASMARQLSAVSHFDFDPEAIHQVAIFFKSVLIAPRAVESQHASWRAESFGDFIESRNAEFFELLHR